MKFNNSEPITSGGVADLYEGRRQNVKF